METKLNELLVFPCRFTFKIIGEAQDTLISEVVSVIQSYKQGDYTPAVKRSRNGNYYSISITITATSGDEIELLYQAISKINGVRMVL